MVNIVAIFKKTYFEKPAAIECLTRKISHFLEKKEASTSYWKNQSANKNFT